MSWTVRNQGIGTTNVGEWRDRVFLATDPAGTDRVKSLGSFDHFGHLAVGGEYSRDVQIPLPADLSGQFYVVVETGGPYEFLLTQNNSGQSAVVNILSSPLPDLAVTDVVSPATATEGTSVDVTWTVQNLGTRAAEGPWIDRLQLQEVGNADNRIPLGQFSFTGPLDPTRHYTRTESVRIPARIQGIYHLRVVSDADGAVYEGADTVNNVGQPAAPLTVAVQPRPDLTITVTAPDTVDAGGSFAVEFEVSNQGTVPTTVPSWVDRVYLSLDGAITRDDIVVETSSNQSALGPGESYRVTTNTVVVPERFRGEVFVLAQADSDKQVDEWPNEDNLAQATVFVTPLPLPDLVVSDVVAPVQATEGSQIEVRYTVTNLGSGETTVTQWTDSIWLTRDKNRPHPGEGDILLTTVPHEGGLAVNGGYDQIVNVTLPTGIPSGNYFITPWSDPFGVVLEDTLAINVNPDDPNEIDNNNYKARGLALITQLPDLAVTEVLSVTQAQGGDTINVTWTVENQSPAATNDSVWTDRIYLSDRPDPFEPGARRMLLRDVPHQGPLGPGASYHKTTDIPLTPSADGKYIVVVTDGGVETVAEIDEQNNAASVASDIKPIPADLKITEIVVAAENLSGEHATIRYTVTNVGQHALWTGTEFWKDFIWVSSDATFIRNRASYLGQAVTASPGVLGPGDSYEVVFGTTLPQGLDGDYFIHIHLDAHNDLSPFLVPMGSRILLTDWWPANSGTNSAWLSEFTRWAFEDPNNNLASQPINITYNEPDLVIADLSVPATAFSGDNISVTYTVTNLGTRDTRTGEWNDRVFLSHDASLDDRDLFLGEFKRRGILEVNESYSSSIPVRLPDGIEGPFHLLVFTDSIAEQDRASNSPPSNIGFGLPGVEFESTNPFIPFDMASLAQRAVARGDVFEFQEEGNNIAVASLPVRLTNAPDLQVTSVVAPQRATVGQMMDISYTVTNFGGSTPDTQSRWDDLIYFSRDEYLDLRADRFLGVVERKNGLLSGDRYSITTSIDVPSDLLGPYFLFVVTDPLRGTDIGRVFEGANERNNDFPAAPPVVLELPPPTDLQVQDIRIPAAATIGNSLDISWTVTNASAEPASGVWSDSVYLSTDSEWDINDRIIGRSTFTGTLLPGQDYDLNLAAELPSVTPGTYRVIVRTDIFNQIYEDTGETNNTTASADTLDVSAISIELGVPFDSELFSGQQRLLQLTVPAGQTMRVRLRSPHQDAAHELFIRHSAAPTPAVFDASYSGGLAANQTAIVPDTKPGVYYVLVRSHSEPLEPAPITILAELLPITITDVSTDTGGDDQFVTTRIDGAKFDADAIVKLIRPGLNELEPVAIKVVNSTQILATFDLTNAVHGLYDLKVLNPTGEEAISPYRFLVQQRIEPDVTIGVGGPRAILAGDLGTYSVALQGLGNLDTPYTFFQVGIPELGLNEFVYGLPYLNLTTNVRGTPTGAELGSLPWASLVNENNTNGHVLSPGYLLHNPTAGFTGFTFNVLTYPGLTELYDRAFDKLREQIYNLFPDHREAGTLDDGPQGLDDVFPGLFALFNALGGIPDELTQEFIPFQFHVVAGATAMSRDEFVAHSLEQAETIRAAIIDDPDAPAGLVTLAANPTTFGQMFLVALEESGLLLPDGQVPPLATHPQIVSLQATLASGFLAGPAGSNIVSTGSVAEFFSQLRQWYGHDSELLAPIESINPHNNPIAELPSPDDFDLGLGRESHFETFRVLCSLDTVREPRRGLTGQFPDQRR